MIPYATAAAIQNRAKETIIPLPSQKATVETISTILSLHLRRLEALRSGVAPEFLPRISQLLIAPTGCGKSYLISQLAKVCHLGFSTIDASELTFSGFKGVNLNEKFTELEKAFQGPGLFEESIILIDEFDKLAIRNSREAYGNAQPNFLKLLENGSITLKPDSCGKHAALDTSRMLFILCGAFSGLEEIIQNRLKPEKRIGFYTENPDSLTEKDILNQATMKDIENYGFMPELLGRIGYLHVLPELQKEDYRQLISCGRASEEQKFNQLFQASGVEFKITDSAAEYIAGLGIEKHLGARFITPLLLDKLKPAFQEVEQNSAINQVILTYSESEHELELLYETGERFQQSKSVESAELPIATCPDFPDVTDEMFASMPIKDFISRNDQKQLLKILTTHALEHHLMKPDEREFFEVFLNLYLHFLENNANQEDQTLHSLQKLAESSLIKDHNQSTMEIMVQDAMDQYPYNPPFAFTMYFSRFKQLHSDYRVQRVCQILNDTYRTMNCMMIANQITGDNNHD